MALAGTARKASRNVFGVSLSEDYAAELRARAEDLSMPPTTLASRLLERALAERKGGAAAAGPVTETGGSQQALTQIAASIEALHSELATASKAITNLHRATINSAIKLLRTAGGMSPADINDWISKHVESRR